MNLISLDYGVEFQCYMLEAFILKVVVFCNLAG